MDFAKEYSIYTPRLKSSTGKPVRVNAKLGNFTYDFNSLALEQFKLNAVSFCFFILWDADGGLSGTLNPNIWIKKEISIAVDKKININDHNTFDRKFFEDEPIPTVKCKQAFFSRNRLNMSYLVIRDLKNNWSPSQDQSVAIEITYDHTAKRLLKTPISLRNFQELLVKESNRPMSINKPLYSYETDLEKYLSLTCRSTGALFPGDCDMLLFDNNYVCQYIVEFKKTTSRDHVPIKGQSFSNHLDRDKNKFTRLNILRNYFSAMESKTIPFVTVFYPVTDENEIKIEVISPDLKVERACVFSFGEDPTENQKMILEKIVELCG